MAAPPVPLQHAPQPAQRPMVLDPSLVAAEQHRRSEAECKLAYDLIALAASCRPEGGEDDKDTTRRAEMFWRWTVGDGWPFSWPAEVTDTGGTNGKP